MSVGSSSSSSCNNRYEFFERIGRPKLVVAPMVDQSDLAFRMMTRKYGATLVYTQMFNANSFIESKEYRELNFTTCAQDRPLFVQFAGHDAQQLLQAAKMVEDRCDAVDINLGCPQAIAKRGRYGAYLMEELDLLAEIVSTLAANLKVPVTCKTRIYKNDFERSIRLCETLVNAGASLLTIHGRSRDEKGHKVAEVDWQMIQRIKAHFGDRVPIIANGGIECYDDVERCLAVTGCDGVMSSEAILETPTLFTNPRELIGSDLANVSTNHLDIAKEYLRFAENYPVWPFKAVRSHIYKYLHRYFCCFTDLRETAANAQTIEELYSITELCRQLVNQATEQELERMRSCNDSNDNNVIEVEGIATIHQKLFGESWYRRHRLTPTGATYSAESHASSCQRAVDCCKEAFWEAVSAEAEGVFDGLNMFD